jgi:hypothetical protein
MFKNKVKKNIVNLMQVSNACLKLGLWPGQIKDQKEFWAMKME